MPETLRHSEAFKFLSEEELRDLIPAAYTAMPAKRAHEGYTIVKTPVTIDYLAKQNWKPIIAQQVEPKLAENVGYQKHFIRFRNNEVYVGAKNAIEAIPELVLVNSYDARSSIKLYIGMYRPASENGLIFHSSKFPSLDMTHRSDFDNDEYKRQRDAILVAVKDSPKLLEEMKRINLTYHQQKQYAQECCRARWDYKYKLTSPQEFLTPLRYEDEGADLWTVYNRVHEKMLNGGWNNNGKKVKPLLDPNRAHKVRVRLFDITETYLTKFK